MQKLRLTPGLSGSLPLSPLPTLPSLPVGPYLYPKILEYLFLRGGAGSGSVLDVAMSPEGTPAGDGENRRSPRLDGAKGVGGDGRKGKTGDEPVRYAVIGELGPAPVSPRAPKTLVLVGEGGAAVVVRPTGAAGRDGPARGDACRKDGELLYNDGDPEESVPDLNAFTFVD